MAILFLRNFYFYFLFFIFKISSKIFKKKAIWTAWVFSRYLFRYTSYIKLWSNIDGDNYKVYIFYGAYLPEIRYYFFVLWNFHWKFSMEKKNKGILFKMKGSFSLEWWIWRCGNVHFTLKLSIHCIACIFIEEISITNF